MYEYPVKEEEKKPKIIPFKVHFCNKILHGKSYVRVGVPQSVPHTVTEKFYTKNRYNFQPEYIDKEGDKLKILGPKEKYRTSVTENQRYGWFHEVKFTDIDKNDKRVYFTKQMDHLIKLFLQTMDKKSR